MTVLQRKSPRAYGAGQVVESIPAQKSALQPLTISWQGESFQGNNQDILLEQLEMAGVRVPYSCRAGLCGSCKITLVSGEVKALKQSAVRKDGTILSCSCVPAGDIELA